MAATLKAPPAKPAASPQKTASATMPPETAYRGDARLDSQEPVLLEGVSWDFYLTAREQFSNATRITYDDGRMEIMPPPSASHESDKITLSRLLDIYLDARGIDFDGYGSVILPSPQKKRGVEPDASYYVAADPPPPGIRQVDLSVHNPPDLVIEVDLTSHSLDKEPIYAAFGVAELWRVDGDAFTIRRLRDDRAGYDDSPTSGLLPELPVDALAAHVRLGRELPQSEVVRRWRQVIESKQRGDHPAPQSAGRFATIRAVSTLTRTTRPTNSAT